MKRPVVATHGSPEHVEAQWQEALREADVARLMRLWSDDEDILCVMPDGGRHQGAQAVAAAWQRWLGEGRRRIDSQARQIVRGADWAVVSTLERHALQGAGGGTTHVLAVAVTRTLAAAAGGWRVVAWHGSPGREAAPATPAHPDHPAAPGPDAPLH